MKTSLEIRVLGELQVLRGDERLSLPRSKKTRALLAYLVVTGREQRRARLCEMFWDVADDPRAALRWSLSKLRKLVNGDTGDCLVADRQVARFEREGADVDLFALRELHRRGFDEVSVEELEAVAGRIGGELLEGLELSDFDDFQAWIVAEREQARRHHAALLTELTARLDAEPERALPHARKRVQIDPMEEQARVRFIELLGRTGRRDEVEQQYRSGKRLFAELGATSTGALQRAYRDALKGQPEATASVSTPVPETQSSLQVAGLFGRREELKRLRTIVDEAAQGQLRVVLLLGEPGVGKSRLLEELIADVRGRGGDVLAGASFEVERDRPYGPWIDALRGTSKHQVGEGIGANLATLLPELGDADVGEEEMTRDRLFGAVVELVAARAHSAPPVLILLDDIHWWDEASASLLHYVVRMNRHRPVLVALAARDGELPDNDAALRVVRMLRREQLLVELPIGPLSQDETRELVSSIAPELVTESMYEDCAGNPLFALEIARSGTRAGGYASSVTQLVRDRIDRLPSEGADVLRWAAVLGHDFGVARLSQLTVLDPLDLASALEQLERHALLTPTDRMGMYRFAHDLVRQVVYAELSTPRRLLMHHRVATVLNTQEEPDESVSAEIARHAAAAGDAELASRACVTAGKRGLRLVAPAEAYALARRGLHHAEQLTGIERVTRLIELTEVSNAARRPADPEEAASRIERLAEEALDYGATKHARRAFNILSYIRWEVGDGQFALRTMLEAERVSRGATEEERVLALAEAARCLVLLDRDLPQAEAMSLEAIALSNRLGVERPAVPDSAGMLRMHRGEMSEARELFDRARVLARRRRNRFSEYQAMEHLVVVDFEEARFDDAARTAKELTALAEKFRDGSEAPFSRALVALCDHARGDSDATAVLKTAFEELRQADAKQRLSYALSRAAEIDLRRGDYATARDRAAEAIEMAEILNHSSEVLFSRAMLFEAQKALGEEGAEEQLRHLREASLAGVAIPVRKLVERVIGAGAGRDMTGRS